MGATHSKGSVVTTSPAHPAVARQSGAHTALPQDVMPYQGPSLELFVVSVPVQMTSHFVSGFSAGNTAATSNVDNYYPMIAGYLGQGYSLATFYRVPGASSMSGFTSATVPFEAVFSRPVGAPVASPTGNRLFVDKATMYTQRFQGGILTATSAHGSVSDTSDIMNKIYHHSSQGGRLICVEINGQVVTQGMSAAMAGVGTGVGVDVLLEVPPQPCPAQYVYQVVNVPIGVTVQFGIPARVQVNCDWFGILAAYLNQGWKLVEIFLDQSQQRAGGFSTACSMNSIWFFEKEASKMQDPTPIYEGTVVEYYHKVSVGFGGAKVKTDWSGVISQMGQNGWELACIQETPEVIQSGFGKIQIKLMMFFQRRIMNPSNVGPPAFPGMTSNPPPVTAPPPYQPPMQSPPTQASQFPPASNTGPLSDDNKTPL